MRIGQRATKLAEEELRALGPLSVKVRNLVDDLDLPRAEQYVLKAILDHCDAEWCCFPGTKRICEKSKYSDTAVKRARRAIIGKGLVTVTRRASGNGWASNAYTVNVGAISARANGPTSVHDGPTPGAMVAPPGAVLAPPPGAMVASEVAIREEATQEAIQRATQDASAREDNHLSPSTDEPTTKPGIAGSDVLAPSRSQSETAPPASEKRAYQPDLSRMQVMTCADPECSRTWREWQINARAGMLCPDIHRPLEVKRKTNEKAKAQRMKRAS